MATNLQQIEEMFHRAMEVRPEERAGYLDSACSDDNDLREEVDSLISAYESNSGMFDEAAVTLAMRVLGSTSADSMKGKEVGPYKILSLLGQGGMGAVYLAENRRVNKKVALKFLSAEFFEDNWGKRQLIKEAQAVAMLDHPNICAVYDFEEVDDHSFIVMQYIEGQTLADLIRKKSVKPGQYVSLAQQIANALAAAHAHGIIHRDIKPRNIMVTPSEQVKVLDFGLAKTMQKSLEEESISQLSRDGLLVGTVAYMSPEQLRGEKLDYRSDIFSLGTVLYEMGCGKNPFAHKTNSKGSKSNAEVISAIMAEEPQSLRQVALNCPKGFDHVVDKCLKKDRAERYQSAAELLIDLEDVQKGVVLQPHVSPYLNVRMAALAAMVLLAVVVGLFVYLAWGSSRQTLAVLPITCDEATIKTQCVGPELTDGLVKALGRRNGLRVKSSQVAPSLFGPQAASPQKVGKDMDADIVMFGKISRGEKGLVLTLRMERVKDGAKLVEEGEPLNADNLPMLAQWISLKTAMQLQLPMNESDNTLFNALATQQNQSGDAVRLYMLGRTHWNNRDGENIQNAIDYFVQAKEKDPLFAKAYAGLADCYVEMTTARYGALANRDAMPKAEWAAKTALSLDDSLAEAHSAYATVLMRGKWDWENAQKEFERAIALNPDYSPAHLGYSTLLRHAGRMFEALVESKAAMDLEPFSATAIMSHCRTQYFARQFDEADACLAKLAKEQPNFANGKYMRGIVYIQLGRIQEATQIYEEIYAKNRVLGGAMLGFVYSISNRRAEAERVLAEMQGLQATNYIPPQEFAIIYFGLDDLDHAFLFLRKAAEEKFPSTQGVFLDPMFDRYRSDPRFIELAREVRLPLHPLSTSAALNYSAK
jgi:tRNA A-37 threonylcarbamoyl transferase component Bud32/tetratricopeptide (TPR) repeat protein